MIKASNYIPDVRYMNREELETVATAYFSLLFALRNWFVSRTVATLLVGGSKTRLYKLLEAGHVKSLGPRKESHNSAKRFSAVDCIENCSITRNPRK